MLRFFIAAVFAAVCSISYAQSLPTPNVSGLKVNGTAQTFPASGSIAGTSDTQTLTNKAINSGTLARSLSYSGAIKCDGTTDDTTAIQDAINAIPATGGTLILPQTGHPCVISSTIIIGNSDGSALSTINGIGIVGGGMGTSNNEAGGFHGGVVLKWTGASGGTAIQVDGPIDGIRLQGIDVDCNSLCATGFHLIHPIASHFQDLEVENQIGQAFIHEAVPESSIAVGSGLNVFQNIKAIFPVNGSGAGCITIGSADYGSVSRHLDVARNIYEHLECARDASQSSSVAIDLRYLDNSEFIGVFTIPFYGTAGVGMKVDPPSGSIGFPNELSFFGAAIDSFSSPNNAAVWSPGRGLGFYGLSQGDGEPLPSDSGKVGDVFGITTTGALFGGGAIVNSWTPAFGTNSGSGYTFSLTSAHYQQSNGEVLFSVTFQVTGIGTGASGVTLTLPFNATNNAAVNAYNGVYGSCYGVIVTNTPNQVLIRRYDGTFPANGTGQFITVSGTYPS